MDIPAVLSSGIKLLTIDNPKIAKSIARGYATAGLHLAPALESGYNTCAKHTPDCAANCLYFSGFGALQSTQRARRNKTRRFFEDRRAFLADLFIDIRRFIDNAHLVNLDPVLRLNLTQDIPWEKYGVPQAFPLRRFYDYTKLPRRKVPSNYHLTFSFSGSNLADCKTALANGMNVAVPFLKAPATWLGAPVINGDDDDLRFLETRGHVIALSAKGPLKKAPFSPFLGDNHAA